LVQKYPRRGIFSINEKPCHLFKATTYIQKFMEPIKVKLSYLLEVILENLGNWRNVPFDDLLLQRVRSPYLRVEPEETTDVVLILLERYPTQ